MIPGACVFDLGNTLVPDTRLYQEVLPDFASHLERSGMIPSAAEFAETYTRVNRGSHAPFVSHTYGEESFFVETFSVLGVARISPREAMEEYRRRLMDRMSVREETIRALTLLRERGIRVALLSNESVPRVAEFFKNTGLRRLFDEIVVSDAVGYEKPDPRIFQLLLKRLDLQPTRVVMFGDNAVADGACRLLGMTFVLVTEHRNKDWAWERGDVHSPDHVMERIDPEQMEALLETWGDGGG